MGLGEDQGKQGEEKVGWLEVFDQFLTYFP